jgi:ribonuclease HII
MKNKEFDISFYNQSVKIIAGIDEAGRGPLAGPVVAAAVIFEPGVVIPEIDDSKKISEKKREELFDKIIDQSVSYGIAEVSVEKIEEINILQSSLMAMRLAAGKLNVKPDLLLIDGNKSFASKVKVQTIVKGDSKSFSIGAASILAKVWRDRLMRAYAEKYPEYGWEKNKGYGTKAHIEAIKKYGVTPLHRKKFLRKILEENLDEEFGRLFK